MEIKENFLKTKNFHTHRTIIVNLNLIDYFDFVLNPEDPRQSYTQLWIGPNHLKIPCAYLLLMKHFKFFEDGNDVRDNGKIK